VLLGGVLLVGSAIRAVWRRRIVAALLSAAIGLAMVGVGGFAAYVAAIGSDLLTHPTANTDCRTPMSRFAWTYEAINYDVADDSLLGNSNPDPEHCSTQGQAAGTDVVTSDGVGIAGWYIPAADGAGPAAPTVVLVHGWGANKSEVLKYAVPLHEHYNVVAFDLRGGGRSGNAATTFGLREQQDLEAVIDWLERAKHPTHVAVMGNSMGGGTAAIAAASDLRIEALILDSTHAYVANIVERRLEVDSGYPAHPGTSAIVAGVWVRTGLDLMTADPVRAITSLGDRPLLLLHGAADIHDVPAQSVDVIYAAAESAGVSVERHFCPDASHGKVIDTCPAQWGEWATAFLDRVLR
ncbi:MAG: alpha/beta fold hydrolase, partial [Chloroflexota bacterium]